MAKVTKILAGNGYAYTLKPGEEAKLTAAADPAAGPVWLEVEQELDPLAMAPGERVALSAVAAYVEIDVDDEPDVAV